MLLNHSAGFEFVKAHLSSRGFIIRSTSLRNKGRHCLLNTEDSVSHKEEKFYVVFKREPFHSFNHQFPEFIHSFPLMAGFGESINVEYLELARQHDALILFVYEDHKIYAVNSTYLYKFVYEKKLIREQNKNNEYKEAYSNGAVQVIRERTASFPLKIMYRFE